MPARHLAHRFGSARTAWRSEWRGKGSGSRALVAGGDASAASTLEADRFSCQTLPCCVCRFIWRSDGDYPCVGLHISRRENARRLSPSDLRTTLPDLCALAKRPLASPHRAEDWRGSVDDQPRAWSQHRGARVSLPASAREGLAEAQGGLGPATQNDAGPGGADRGETDARAVESRSDQRPSGEGWRRLYQSRAHLSACLERQERRGRTASSLASQRQKIQQAERQEFGARVDSEPR